MEAPELLQLPLLPLFQSVLLPGGFLRVLIPKAWRKSAALVSFRARGIASAWSPTSAAKAPPGPRRAVRRQALTPCSARVPQVQHLLQQQGGEVYVAAVPYFPSRSLGDEDAAEQHQLEENLDLDRLHSVGTAARVLQLLRRTEVRRRLRGGRVGAAACACSCPGVNTCTC